MAYIAGTNQPGHMPDSEPAEFDSSRAIDSSSCAVHWALAQEIAQGIANARKFDASVNADALRQPFDNGRIHALQSLARRLTFRFAVDRTAFLKACGIDS